MKKITLFIFAVIFATISANAQSFTLSNLDGPVPNGSSINVWGDTTTGLAMKSHIFITNNAGVYKSVKITKTNVSLISHLTENSFCWGTCYGPTTFTSPVARNIAAGYTDTDGFEGDYYANGFLGTSTVKYLFFDTLNVNDTVCFYVNYMGIGLGLNDAAINNTEFSNAYPNPANTSTTFNYKIQSGAVNTTLIIRNLIGSVVKEARIDDQQGKLVISTQELKAGIYFYSLIVDDKNLLTKKLVVKH